MRHLYLHILASVALVFVIGGATGHAAVREDLTACKLPNGVTVLPSRGSPGAMKAGGYIFKFATQKFAMNPFEAEDTRPTSIAELFKVMREKQTGDLMYSTVNKGTLLAVSGRMADLGRHYLYELSGQELARPAEAWSVKERSGKGERTPGAIEEVGEGHCYIVETTDGKYALIRIVAFFERAAQIQWVFQPDGSTKFDIPQSEPIPVAVPEPAKPASGVGHPSAGPDKPFEVPLGELRVTDPDAAIRVVDTHLKNRAVLVKGLMTALSQGQDRHLKGLAAKLLGDLRADEAAPLLASMIDFAGIPYGTGVLSDTIESSYPCAGALARLGIAGANAAMTELAKLGEVTEANETRHRVCLYVVRKVYGDKLTEFVLKDRLANAKSDTERAAFEAAVKALNVGG